MIDGDVDKESVSLMEGVKRLRGPEGYKGDDHHHEGGFAKPQEFTLVRDVIPVRSVRYELMDKQYGYIRLSQFQEKTDGDLEKAVKALETESKGTLKGLILDLRNNPGGFSIRRSRLRIVLSIRVLSFLWREEKKSRK